MNLQASIDGIIEDSLNDIIKQHSGNSGTQNRILVINLEPNELFAKQTSETHTLPNDKTKPRNISHSQLRETLLSNLENEKYLLSNEDEEDIFSLAAAGLLDEIISLKAGVIFARLGKFNALKKLIIKRRNALTEKEIAIFIALILQFDHNSTKGAGVLNDDQAFKDFREKCRKIFADAKDSDLMSLFLLGFLLGVPCNRELLIVQLKSLKFPETTKLLESLYFFVKYQNFIHSEQAHFLQISLDNLCQYLGALIDAQFLTIYLNEDVQILIQKIKVAVGEKIEEIELRQSIESLNEVLEMDSKLEKSDKKKKAKKPLYDRIRKDVIYI